MIYPTRSAALVMAPFALMLMAACSPAVGDNSSVPAIPLSDIASLADRPVISFAFTHPSLSVIQDRWGQPLMDHLTSQTPYMARALFSTDSEKTVGMLEQRLAELAQLGVVDYLEARHQLGVEPLARPLNRDGQPVSYSFFVAREDSPLRSLTDLKGRSLALGSFHSTLSNLIPRHELSRAGVDIAELGRLEHLDNDEAIASAVVAGHFDAGVVEDVVARRYRDKGLRAFHVSPPVPSAPFVIRADMPQRVSQAIRQALLRLDFEGAKDRQHWDEDLRYGFAPASDADYLPMRRILESSLEGCRLSCHVGE